MKRKKEDVYRIAQGLGIDPSGKDKQELIQQIFKDKGLCYEMYEDKPYTIKYPKHQPISFTYYIKYANTHYKDPVDYVAEGASRRLVTLLEQKTIHIKGIYDEVFHTNRRLLSRNKSLR